MASQSTKEVTLLIDDIPFVCDKILLSNRSEYFNAMFRSNMIESSADTIPLYDISVDEAKLLLDNIRYNNPHLTPSNIFTLTHLACRFQCINILTSCQKFLTDHLSTKNCLRSMIVADLCALNDLYNKAKELALWEFRTISNLCDEFLKMEKDNVLEYLQDDMLNVSCEFDVLKACLKWISYDLLAREHYLEEILSVVRIDIFKDLESNQINDVWKYSSESVRETLNRLHKSGIMNKERRLVPYKLIIIGGDIFQNEEKVTNPKIFELSVSTNDIKGVTSIPFREELSKDGKKFSTNGIQCCMIGCNLFIAGGEIKTQNRNWNYDIWKYNSIFKSWEKLKTQMPLPRRHHSMCGKDDVIYFIGGFGRHRIVLDSFESYNLKTGDWSTLACLHSPVFSAACTIYDNQIFVVKHNIEFYNIDTGLWTVITAPIPFEVGLHEAMTYGEMIYFTGHYILNIIEFNPKTYEIEILNSFKKASGRAVMINGKIYAISGDECDKVEIYDVAINKMLNPITLHFTFMNHLVGKIPNYPVFRKSINNSS